MPWETGAMADYCKVGKKPLRVVYHREEQELNKLLPSSFKVFGSSSFHFQTFHEIFPLTLPKIYKCTQFQKNISGTT